MSGQFPGRSLDSRDQLERFQAKWIPVRVKKTRQIKNLEPRFDSTETEKALVLTTIVDRALLHTCGLGPGVKCHSHFFRVHESPADVSVLRTGIERNEPIAVLAVGLEPVADLLRPLPEYLRAFRAFNSYFFFDHEMSPDSMRAFCLPWFKDLSIGLLNA
jgi:hypothetical protein